MTTYQDIHRRSEPNFLLQGLDESTARNLLAQMELVPVVLGKVLQEPGIASRHAYFPTTCVISLLCGMENGSAAEIAVIGNEGMVGVTNILGGDVSPIQAVVQSTGYAYRIRMNVLRQEFQSNPELQTALLKYMQALMAQMGQTAVCNRHHTLDQQLCRWFLHCLDRLPSNELVITQEFIAHMLGVRREGVTAAAGKLQKAGIINYRRGRISINDRAGLEARACECYDLVRKEYQRLLPIPTQEFETPKAVNGWQNESFNAQYTPLSVPNRDRAAARA
jgi:CRP-like cAMP-binding protein